MIAFKFQYLPVNMNSDKLKKTPCGFCFVEYYTRKEAERCVKYINSTVIDGLWLGRSYTVYSVTAFKVEYY